MPELPEVEVIARALRARILGLSIDRVVVRNRNLRTRVPSSRRLTAITGQPLVGIRRRAKYLLFDLGSEATLLVHLGMTGRLLLLPAAASHEEHDHVSFLLSDTSELRYNDVRRFGMIDVFERRTEGVHPRLASIGPDPFDVDLTPEILAGRGGLGGRPIKSFLLDGARVAGIGNIYACEALFRARIAPSRLVRAMDLDAWAALLASLRTVLSEAISAGGTTLRDYRDADGRRGLNAGNLRVYGRAGLPCLQCGTEVQRAVQAGRSTFCCPRCQRA